MTSETSGRLSGALLATMRQQAERGMHVPPGNVTRLVDEVTRLRAETTRRGPCAGCPFAGCDCQWQGGK